MSRLSLFFFSVGLAAVLITISSSAPSHSRQKRGFRNAALSTARGFGKRMQQSGTLEELGLHSDFNRPMASSWLAEQIARSPALAKLLVEKVIDQNGDGMINPDEMFQAL
ncbi:allatotropins-like [Stegodyphus dumicola]|uniref:allatotropins-like n=1 Tax=Stegodyphus dumicola TaxID=202533 RepID=UPI0015B2E493|nr:allatotropins-like [Stegodyphus dumicola]